MSKQGNTKRRCRETGKPTLTRTAAEQYAVTRNRIQADSHTHDECRHCGGWHTWRFIDTPEPTP